MDHMLLGPESFVARFLSWLHHPGFHMAGMACGPDTLGTRLNSTSVFCLLEAVLAHSPF